MYCLSCGKRTEKIEKGDQCNKCRVISSKYYKEALVEFERGVKEMEEYRRHGRRIDAVKIDGKIYRRFYKE